MRELERDKNQGRQASAVSSSPPLAAMPPLLLVGAGRVGSAIHRIASARGLEVTLAGRDTVVSDCRSAELVLLCVPDAAIPEACEAVCAAAPRLRFLGHTSGATGLAALAPAEDRGAAVFSAHPLQTIPDGGAELSGAACAVSASSEEAARLARELARALGMRPFDLPEESRAAYHAAASIASNFLVALEESAAEILRRAGLEKPRELLAPLVRRSAANWSERGAGALTGPIARGDEETVERHLEALAALCPELLETYLALAARSRAIAAEGAVA